MSYRPNRQEQTRAHQLELPLEPRRRMVADNQDDPFAWSAPRHSGGMNRRGFSLVPGMKNGAPRGLVGLSLADLAARVGDAWDQPAANASHK
jgi:hypothetical protein